MEELLAVIGCLGIAFVLAVEFVVLGPLTVAFFRRLRAEGWPGRAVLELPVVYEFVAAIWLVLTVPLGLFGLVVCLLGQ